MGHIKILSELVANKIAAGEIIERPASIVKELLENAIDAGAKAVEIQIEHGGRSLIRVADDGCGMSSEDAELALERHATSKISEAEDLNHVLSFGFRGEALPSIGAVSRLKLLTRPHGAGIGTEITVEGGAKTSVKQSACREGTIVEVRDLFFNTPVRRKFMKTDPTEMGHITDAVSNCAMACPEIRFTLRSGKKTVLDLIPAASLTERARAVLGEEAAPHMLEISGEGSAGKVTGLISRPHLSRANRLGQTFFVNRRWIRSSGIAFAAQDGYHGLIMHGQYPVMVLFIEVDPERVDVNVHPTKQEVRISKENEIKSLIRRTVAERLQQEGDLSPTLQVRDSFPSSSRPRVPDLKLNVGFYDQTQKISTPVKTAEHFEETTALPENPAAEEPITLRDHLQIIKILGQIHHTFIVAETQEGMIVIDQHAAHERVMFETLLKEFSAGQVHQQRLLMEEMMELHPRQKEIFEEHLPFLRKLGFDLESFGETTYVLRAYPSILAEENPVVLLKHFAEEAESGKLRTELGNKNETVAALMACKKKSVKAHDPMTMESMRGLLTGLSRCENPFHCPHGRPTFFKHTFSDLEKQFKRK